MAKCISAVLPESLPHNWRGEGDSPYARPLRRAPRQRLPRLAVLPVRYSHQYGGGGGIRTPEGCNTLTVFKTVAIDHSATPPALVCHSSLAGREGLEPPTNGFGDRYSTN